MKKNYFMLVCLILLSAFSAKIQAASVASLYGNYKFTADIKLTAEGESYKNLFVNECDATIGEDPSGIYGGAIFGFAGVQDALKFNFSDNTLEVMNSNSVSVGSGLLFADADANNPYGVFKDGSWVHMSFTPSFTYNPSTKEIVVPDFTVVSVANAGKDEKGTVMATYTNVKLTCVDGSETPEAPAFEWAGTHTVNAKMVTAYDGNEYPASFDITIVNDGDKCLVTNIWGNDVTSLNNGGIAFTVAADGKSAQMATGGFVAGAYPIYYVIKDMNAQTNPINLALNEDGTISVDDFFIQSLNYETNATAPIVFYQGVTIGTAVNPETPAFNWVGQHTVKVGKIDVYDGKTYPSEFTMTVTEGANGYLVTEFFSADIAGLNNGGINFVVAADGKSAEMNTAAFVGGAYPDYLVIFDMNSGESPIRFTLNEDGSVVIDNFFVQTFNYESYKTSAAAYFQNVTIPAVGGAEEPETTAFDWLGTWEVTAAGQHSYDGKEYPSTFYMTIEENSGYIFVTEFMGTNVKSLNNGGILLTIAQDNKSAELTTGVFAGGKYPEYLVIYDMNASLYPIELTANEDGTISFANFCLKSYNYNTQAEALAVYYMDVTASKCPTGIESVVENNAVQGIFDIQGRKIDAITAPGLYIVNGKKVLVK